MNRKLRDRLSKLESPQGAELSRSDHMLLVSILGRRDAMFWPWRFQQHDRTPHPEIRRRQREYLAGQIGIAVKADGRAAWKDASATRQRLITTGMITANHASGQVQSVFLTPLGEAYARKLVGDRLETYQGAWPWLVTLILRSKQTSCSAVRESVLFDIEGVGDPTSWNHYTEMMLPLLTAGVVEANSDTQGRAVYTPKPIDAPEAITVDITADPDFDDACVEAFNSERQVLATVEPRDPHEVYIPLPATGWGWPIHFEEANQ